jgi:hypothetical protein
MYSLRPVSSGAVLPHAVHTDIGEELVLGGSGLRRIAEEERLPIIRRIRIEVIALINHAVTRPFPYLCGRPGHAPIVAESSGLHRTIACRKLRLILSPISLSSSGSFLGPNTSTAIQRSTTDA